MAEAERLQRTKERAWGTALGVVITVSIILLGTLVWLFWPYPGVSTQGAATLTNLDSRGYYETGDVIRWVTPEVCQPEGVTEVTIEATLDFVGPDGAVATTDTTVVSRTFDVSGFPDCVQNNPTAVYVDGNLPSGVYRFTIHACVQNPTPRGKCGTFEGPSGVRIVRVAGNEPSVIPSRTPVA